MWQRRRRHFLKKGEKICANGSGFLWRDVTCLRGTMMSSSSSSSGTRSREIPVRHVFIFGRTTRPLVCNDSQLCDPSNPKFADLSCAYSDPRRTTPFDSWNSIWGTRVSQRPFHQPVRHWMNYFSFDWTWLLHMWWVKVASSGRFRQKKKDSDTKSLKIEIKGHALVHQ